MLIDSTGSVVREQYTGQADTNGDRGDACADTSRLFVLFRNSMLYQRAKLHQFRTDKGYVRHPDLPEDWKESDFSSDQALPLLMALDGNYGFFTDRDEMRFRLKSNRTGNGKLLSPGLWALVHEKYNLLGFFTFIQAVLFLFPFRWSDRETNEDGTKTTFWQRPTWGGDAGDYLNWICTLDYLEGRREIYWPSRLCYMLRSKKRAMAKVREYHANQPNSDWVVQVYQTVLEPVA